jgi:outer membrane receptor protein involved in Fe transport
MKNASSNRPHCFTAIGGILLLLSVAVLRAQNPTARITGTITDSTGAVVPGALVALVNNETGVKVEGKTNESGIYLISFLNPGSYSFTAEAPNFRRYVRALTLVTGQVLQLDLLLEVGQTSESVTVTAETPLLQSATSSINNLIENAFIKNMPLESGRSGGLIRLLPGVTFISEETFEDHLNFAIGGGPARSGEYQLDGGNNTLNTMLSRSIEFNPPVEAVQEIKVEVNGYPAEYGRSTGGIVSMTTKSGTNEFHGALYENFRNNKLDARSFFAPSVAPRKYNVFGAALGGPIRRNKTFFFFSYEGVRRVDGRTRIYSYPTAQEVRGDFSASPGSLLDPVTRTPFPGNIVPASRHDPVGAKLAALFPVPNLTGRANNYVANTSDKISQEAFLPKIDHSFSDRDRIAGRLIVRPATENTGSAIPNRAVDPGVQTRKYKLINVSPSWFHTFGPSLFNEARYTYSHRNGEFPSFEAYGVAGQVGLTGVPADGVPETVVLGLTSLGRANQWRFLKPQITHTTTEALTWFRGKHNVKIGGEWRRTLNRDTWGTSHSGQFGFNDVPTGPGFALASLLLGWPNVVNVVTGDTTTRTDYLAVYIQDDWKATSRLTLNIGLRYDFDTPRWETENRQSGFDPTPINPVSGTPGIVTFSGKNGVSKYAHDWDLNNFGPRFGFAWRAPNDLVVIRGSYGLIFGSAYDSSLGRAMNAGVGDNRNLSSPDNGLTPALLLRNGVPTPPPAELGPGFGAVPVGSPVIFSPDFIDQQHQNLYAHHFNVSVQKQLTETILLEAGYLGNMAHRVAGGGSVNINEIRPELRGATQNQRIRPFPQFGNVVWRAPGWGNSTYNALNIKVEKRFSQGLNFLGTYTWSKFLEDVPPGNELAAATANGQQSYYARHLDKGLSGNDIRHRLATSFVYELPVGSSKPLNIENRVLNGIAGGWSVGMITELRSGSPYSVYEQTNRLNAFSPGQRSNVISDPSLPTDRPRAQLVRQWFDTVAFAFPGNGVLGNASRSPGIGPAFANFDVSLLKDFHFTEARLLQFRTHFYNLFNRANFSNPNGSRGNPAFGQISSVRNDGRFIQFSLRFIF